VELVRVSKLLAFVLRHRPDAIGIELDPDGWTDMTRLVERINASKRLDSSIDRALLDAVLAEDAGTRFALEGERVRARGGHTAPSVTHAKAEKVEAPDFLFAGVLRERVANHLTNRGLEPDPGRMLRLYETERAARRSVAQGRRVRVKIFVIEGQRAQRSGIAFLRAEPGILLASGIPRRFLLSERLGFERQVSAGAVLARAKAAPASGTPPSVEDSFEIALIRTRPRSESDEAVAPSSDEITPLPAIPPEEEPRESDRRMGDERRARDEGPPGGVERREGTRRRRRRRGGWGASGRVELPKGKLEEGERAHEAAIRELREETGLATEVELLKELPWVRYAFRTPEGKSVYKVVHYFLLLSRDANPAFVPQGKEGIVAVEWTSLRDALETIAFGNLKPVLEAAKSALEKGQKDPPPPVDLDMEEEDV
jgi:putative RNA 2'-phosphotransferase